MPIIRIPCERVGWVYPQKNGSWERPWDIWVLDGDLLTSYQLLIVSPLFEVKGSMQKMEKVTLIFQDLAGKNQLENWWVDGGVVGGASWCSGGLVSEKMGGFLRPPKLLISFVGWDFFWWNSAPFFWWEKTNRLCSNPQKCHGNLR